jgi:hypothetical protein
LRKAKVADLIQNENKKKLRRDEQAKQDNAIPRPRCFTLSDKLVEKDTTIFLVTQLDSVVFVHEKILGFQIAMNHNKVSSMQPRESSSSIWDKHEKHTIQVEKFISPVIILTRVKRDKSSSLE